MTRPVLSSYNNIELPTINGDSGVWGTVLNNALNSLDDLVYANEQSAAANATALTTLNANDQTSGSVDFKVTTAINALKNGSTKTLSELETLIGSAGNVDLSTINSQISNLQSNLGAPTSGTLTTAVYPRVQSLESSLSTLVGGTAGDDTKSVRTIATEVIGTSNTGITSTSAQSLIDSSIAAVQGNTTETIAALLTRIQSLESTVATLQQDIATLQSGKASASSVTGLENTVYGTTNTTGLVTSVANASSAATTAQTAASQATADVSTLTTSLTGVTSRVTTLENANYITSSALNDYALQSWVHTNFLDSTELTTALNDYASKQYITNQGFLTSGDLSLYATQQWVLDQGYQTSVVGGAYVSTSDSNWKKVRGLFEGLTDSNRTLPTAIYLSNSAGSTVRNTITSSGNNLIQYTQTTTGTNLQTNDLVNASSADYITNTDTYYLQAKALFGGGGTRPSNLFMGSNSTIYYDNSSVLTKDVSVLSGPTSVDLSNYVQASDTYWKLVRGFFGGGNNSTSVRPNYVYFGNSARIYYNNDFATFKQVSDLNTSTLSSSDFVSTSDSNWLLAKALVGGGGTKPSNIYLGSTSKIYFNNSTSNPIDPDDIILATNSWWLKLYGMVANTSTKPTAIYLGGSTDSTASRIFYNGSSSNYKRIDQLSTASTSNFVSTSDFTWGKLYAMINGVDPTNMYSQLALPDLLYVRPYIGTWPNYSGNTSSHQTNKFIAITCEADNSTGDPHLRIAEYTSVNDTSLRFVHLVNST